MRVVLCNCPPDQAPIIAKALVTEKIAACVNIIAQVQSFYSWQGELCEDIESTLLIKIREQDFATLQRQLEKIHPYDVPEIVELNVSDVNSKYRQWLYEVTTR